MVRPCRAFFIALDLECTSNVKVKEKHVYGGEHYEQKHNNHIYKS